ncbi:ABC transporter ATP-binding protein [Clostridium gasigenes]|uniref:ABC transporter ATP-binding protein n=1 Tax=Clostridium gasigenes TaxID=94869 RepID=A0A7X0R8K0_9CLOT|nr:ABC transporter ATP-binding protein [Clostridium gasigenes]MBB6623664.1 ABC transporter ATP-binding protein [Clostridium gasigenes]MBB6716710.1 ABC transporter ATP-binding protein [Clostridium gasigenes]MBU3087535.1 ABC transporter ATP-binding protein [Clostridium gasigenes]MBU3105338.1 ABC transporter ATP-binding protein [Clostridium gasigenes]MBU3131738.1 ABC transporter ATP-binding protein [Clostridium gasigenes]
MLEVNNVSCGYDGLNVVKNVSFKVNRGENICIVGPNGCGKSTLLKSIANLINYKGNILLDSKEIGGLNRKELATKIALMTQSSHIHFPYTVYETVALGRYAHLKGVFATLSENDNNIIVKCIENVGLLDLKNKLINELSGGQLQRVFLARAFAQDPEVILLDEPTNHLDLRCQIDILEYLNKWTKENNRIVVAVLHDLNLVQSFGESVLMLNNGEVVAKGIPKHVLEEEKLKNVYGINIKTFMLNVLRKWEQ